MEVKMHPYIIFGLAATGLSATAVSMRMKYRRWKWLLIWGFAGIAAVPVADNLVYRIQFFQTAPIHYWGLLAIAWTTLGFTGIAYVHKEDVFEALGKQQLKEWVRDYVIKSRFFFFFLSIVTSFAAAFAIVIAIRPYLPRNWDLDFVGIPIWLVIIMLTYILRAWARKRWFN
jgi:hypothetical protein